MGPFQLYIVSDVYQDFEIMIDDSVKNSLKLFFSLLIIVLIDSVKNVRK
jgi:hypothetical protein